MSVPKYLVRQYRPNHFSGFDNDVVKGVEYDDITKAPWMENFKHSGFTEFKVEPYSGDELIISAYYENGDRIRELATPERDDFDRAVNMLLTDFEQMDKRYEPIVGPLEFWSAPIAAIVIVVVGFWLIHQ